MLKYKKVHLRGGFMKNKKKIIAIVVAIILIVSAFVVGTVANTKTTSVAISIDKTEISAGETATVTVSVTADYPVVLMSIPVFYDKTLLDVSNASTPLTGYTVAEATTDLVAENKDKVYANTGVSSATYGFVLATYIGGANETVSTLTNTTVLTFTITAKADVNGEAVVKCVSASAKTEENIEGALYFGASTSGNKITSIPENVVGVNLESASASVNIVGGSPTLVAKDDKDTAFDDTNKYIYGIAPNANIADYITVNNGSYELVANASGNTNGTGATVKVKNASGTVTDTYTVIVFGDVNGDSIITGIDLVAVSQYVSGTTSALKGVSLVAADINGDKAPTGIDLVAVSQYVSGTSSAIGTNPYA